MRLAIELDQMFSDELAEDVLVIRGQNEDLIRAVVVPTGQEVFTADGLSVGKRAIDLLVRKDKFILGKKLEIPQQNDEFRLCDGTALKLLVGPGGTYEWEVVDTVYRIATAVQ